MKIERQAADTLRLLLGQVPSVTVLDISQSVPFALSETQGEFDIVAEVEASGVRYTLVGEVKSSGQPAHVDRGLLQLRRYADLHRDGIIPVFIAPYLSPTAQARCREHGVGFLDFQGNARVVFGGIFIDRQVTGMPAAERRELKSLFKPKSAQVLRLMLRDPHRAWRVAELAEAAGVSLGHVSNVRAGLLDREWAQVSNSGLFLAKPDILLDEWRDIYEPPAGQRLGFYTAMHGAAFEGILRSSLSQHREAGVSALASFSAAMWLAPYGRNSTHYFYADDNGLDRLHSALKLSSPAKGENVIITVLDDLGPLRDTVEPAPGFVCTSPVQTYLDLAVSGERGREAAEHLRHERLKWQE